MIAVAALLVCLVLAALVVLQIRLLLGAPLGRFAWGGRHDVLPSRLRVGSAVSVGVYALVAVVILARAGLLSLGVPRDLVHAAAWVVAGYFFVGIWLNLASRSKPERQLMSPVAAVLCALCVVVAAS